MSDLDDDAPKKTPRATIIRRALVFTLAVACAGGLVYTRCIVKKGGLGEPCTYDMHCKKDAPRCLKQATEGDGVCSRPCEADAGACAEGIACVSVELDEYDERGKPLQGGYCFPQALLDARKKRPPRDAGAPRDSWVDVPEAAGQLEGRFVVSRGGATSTVEVKGTLLRYAGSGARRTLVDTATLRVYSVDDEKRTFSASQLGAGPGDARITKTDRKDRVADRECDVWIIEELEADRVKTTREACVVRGGSLLDPGGRAASAWEKELAVRGVFPLRVVDPKSDKPRLLVVKAEAAPLDASLFAIPKSYKNLASR